MRLSSKERSAIKTVLNSLDPTAEVYLFGSRVDDQLRGGDIDLLVLSRKLSLSDRVTALYELKLRLGDQKIDLLIKDPDKAKTDPFVLSISSKAIRL